MKFTLAVVLFAVVCATALADDIVSDVAKVLDAEPEAARHRFAEVQGSADTITFREDSAASRGSASSLSDGSGEDSEFDGQIAQVDEDIKKLKDQIKESQECSRRLNEQKAELRALNEQLENLNKEKQKQILQAKLDKQMRDLSEINRMSRALRNKFNDLKRTQQLIKTKLTGTKSSLNQLDAAPDMNTDEVNESTKDIVNEVDAMHKAQSTILSTAQSRNSKEVKTEVTNANKINMQGRKQASVGDDI